MNALVIEKERQYKLVGTYSDYFESVKLFINEWQNTKVLVVQTSGSTGKPKTIHLEYEQVLASINQTQKAFDLNNEDVLVCNLPISYIAGKLMILRALELNCTCIVLEPSANPLLSFPDEAKALLDFNNKNALFAFVPLQIEEIIKYEVCRTIVSAGKAVLLGGTAVNDDLALQIQTLDVPIYATYGMTETVTHVALRRLNGVFKSDFYTFLEGIEHGINEANCLKIKGKTTNNLWIQTNDIIEFKGENSFKIIGRVDNVINSGGVKLHPEIIENKISAIFKAQKITNVFFCYGISDILLGQKLVLFIEGKFSAIETLFKILKSELPKFEIPKEILVLPIFSKTHTGKIDRKKTAENYVQHKVSNL